MGKVELLLTRDCEAGYAPALEKIEGAVLGDITMWLLHLKSIHPLWKILEMGGGSKLSNALTFCVIFRLGLPQRE